MKRCDYRDDLKDDSVFDDLTYRIKSIEEGVSDGDAKVVGNGVSLLVGDEEDDEQKEEVDDDLFEHGFHLEFVQTLLTCRFQRFGVRWGVVDVAHLPLQLHL